MTVLTGEELANVERLAQDRNKKRMSGLARAGQAAAALGGGIARLAGQKGLADALGNAGQAGNDLAKTGGALARAGARKGGLSSGAGAALGGGVQAAFQGEGVKGIAESATSAWVVNAVFVILIASSFTLVGWVLPLMYLNFHFVMSKLGSKIFREMTFLQKIGLAAADLTVLFLLAILILVPVVVICMPQVSTVVWLTSEILKFSGAIPAGVCDAVSKAAGN